MSGLDEKIEVIRENVSIYRLFDASPRRIPYDNETIECQIPCPFHGRDLHKSARVYPQTNSLYCWACGKGWDVISYWAQANEMWTDDGKLHYAKAVNDLMFRFNLRTKSVDWKKRLHKSLSKARQRQGGFSSIPFEERERLSLFMAGRVGSMLKSMSIEDKKDNWDRIATTWNELDDLDLSSEEWRESLTAWETKARSTFNEDHSDTQ